MSTRFLLTLFPLSLIPWILTPTAAISFMANEIDNPALSAVPLTGGHSAGDLGNFTMDHQSIRGSIERTVPFEVVPGEQLTFNIKLWNEDEAEDSGDVQIRLDFPDGSRRSLFQNEIVLQGGEETYRKYSDLVPWNLEVYGRYTAKLFIDGQLADFFQFDLNSRDEIEVRWDDGVMANAWAWSHLCNAWAIRGCLPDGSVLDSIGVYILSEGDPGWPWPDDIHQDILLQVFDNDGSGGLPGTLLFSDVSQVTPGTSHAVAYPGIPISSAFYIANDQLTDYPTCEGQGVDAEVNHPDQMFTRIDDVWGNAGSDYGGDFMIWGVGHIGNQRVTIGNPPNSE